MKPIEELLRNLARPEVLEFGLVTNRLPSVNIGGKFEPVDDEAPTTEALLQMLAALGGSRFVDGLTDKPVQWTTRLEGVGVIAIAAIMRKDVVQARFTVARRDVGATRPSAPSPAAQPEPRPPLARTSSPAPAATRPSPSSGAVQAARPPSGHEPTAKRISGVGPSLPSEDDDDEPTVQTLSPPVAPPSGRPAEAKAAPAKNVDARDGAVAKAAAAIAEEPERKRLSAPPPERSSSQPQRIHTPTSVDAVDVKAKRSDPVPAPPRPASDGEAGVAKPARTVTGTMPAVTAPLAQDTERPPSDGSLATYLAMAVTSRASDLHLVAGRPLLLRIAGELLPRTQAVPTDHVDEIVREIVPPRLREVIDTEGSCDFALDHEEHGRFRVNVSRQRTGHKISMRVVPQEVPTFAALGLPESLALPRKYARGLVLVTGPMGHGKTTTLGALVDQLNRERAIHILALEDPIEIVHTRKRALLTQREVGVHVRSLASGVRAALREDPDVIVVGELRDAEAVRLAVEAAETGHLVLATMNAPSAAKAIERLIDAFPEDDRARAASAVARAVQMIVGQRLVPSVDRTRLHAAVEIVRASVGLFTAIRDLGAASGSAASLRGRTSGVLGLDASLADLVRAEKVTAAAAKAYAELPDALDALVARPASIPVAERKA
jgi:twitching motility protein PilT